MSSAPNETSRRQIRERLQSLKSDLKVLNQDEVFLLDMMKAAQGNSSKVSNAPLTMDRDERDRLIRLGKITPFTQMGSSTSAKYTEIDTSVEFNPENLEETDKEAAEFKDDAMSVTDKAKFVDEIGLEWTDDEAFPQKAVLDEDEYLESEDEDTKSSQGSEDDSEDKDDGTSYLKPSSREDRYLDDGNEPSYQRRLMKWSKERFKKRKALPKVC